MPSVITLLAGEKAICPPPPISTTHREAAHVLGCVLFGTCGHHVHTLWALAAAPVVHASSLDMLLCERKVVVHILDVMGCNSNATGECGLPCDLHVTPVGVVVWAFVGWPVVVFVVILGVVAAGVVAITLAAQHRVVIATAQQRKRMATGAGRQQKMVRQEHIGESCRCPTGAGLVCVQQCILRLLIAAVELTQLQLQTALAPGLTSSPL